LCWLEHVVVVAVGAVGAVAIAAVVDFVALGDLLGQVHTGVLPV